LLPVLRTSATMARDKRLGASFLNKVISDS